MSGRGRTEQGFTPWTTCDHGTWSDVELRVNPFRAGDLVDWNEARDRPNVGLSENSILTDWRRENGPGPYVAIGVHDYIASTFGSAWEPARVRIQPTREGVAPSSYAAIWFVLVKRKEER